ncbi:MAG TPA: NAD(P)/FAD-dependent oxidoreductase [Pyrinomonadaceae bacterium]|nr:NAD(P)/FAD-dependent oxidoreductase [Pyrinomonadaceae bacterium]
MNDLTKIQHDVIVIGAGPAGISAAIWCADLGLRATLIEQGNEPGGQLELIHSPIENYPGLGVRDGAELKKRFIDSLERFDLEVLTGSAVTGVDTIERTVMLDSGKVLHADALFIATGVRRRTLGVPGESEFEGKGILASGAGEKESARGRRVVIIGGGDAAFENVLILREYASHITLIHRGESFRARREFVDPVLDDRSTEVLTNHTVTSIVGRHTVEGVTVKGLESENERVIEADLVLIRIGVRPNSELVAGQVEMDPEGYIVVDAEGRTNCPGIWGIGDVANPVSPTIATAVGTGAAAAKSASKLINPRKSL